jgi:Tfp pilus assembly protein FimT
VEALIVIVILGILSMYVAPRIGTALERRSLSGAREGFAALYASGRMAAVQSRARVTIRVESDLATATVATPNGPRPVGQAVLFQQEFGVTAAATADSVLIQPTGLVTAGLPFELVLSRGAVLTTLRITGYGRVE